MTFDSQCDLAALVYEPDQDPDRVLRDFAAALDRQGARAVGLVQFGHREAGSKRLSALLLHSGEQLPLFQDLGPMATGCRLDTGRLIDAGMQVAGAIDAGADLLIVNRFGRLEREGKGLSYLIDRALSADMPVVIAVPSGRFDDWIKFADGMSVRLRCDADALAAWWASLSARGRGIGRPHITYCDALK
ncbi:MULTISPECIES: DUF2478 domain-containing protein [Rhodopseudomonas]|uniref:DUF2478 domain-containing protein n=1 Tax=Rhodopseudomonas palustris TaxID=1076 RepID=A0A0D7EE04_RHOPL|nr:MULTISPECIES: DUF2478 domain-containing protein [Rhodopseudomonas]KIZ38978.1 hypothetical protein OO17_21840 [Rhodopseudomonas palustris]MDF3809397.1 DUF2478 domain-containing protein [Rhodopseudomonas sp. BAL398]WOK16025.1 DUF2478 domain-containing protein [Rhodopseudomonas sp. BAL398]